MSASVRSLESVRRNAANLVRERIEARTRRVGARVSELAETLRSSVRDLRARDSSFGGDAAESIAERLGSLGHYLEVSDSNRLLADLIALVPSLGPPVDVAKPASKPYEPSFLQNAFTASPP